MTLRRAGALKADDKGPRSPARERGTSGASAFRHAALSLALFALASGLSQGRAATLKDSANRSVDVPDVVKAVVPAGPPAQVLLHALAPDKLAGLVEPIRPEHVIYVDPAIRDLPQIPMLTRTGAPGDVARVAALKPDLVVDYGNASARYTAADEKIQKELGVPTVLYGGGLMDAAQVVRALGGPLGAARAEMLAKTIEDVLGRAKPLAEMADADRVSVYLSRGADGLTGARSGTSFDEPVRLAGGRNVVEGGNGTFKHMSVEDVVALRPAVVIVSDRDALSSPLRAALPKTTRFVLDTGEPYKVLTGPPSINRLVGLAALAAILHPDTFKMVPDDIARVETTLFPIPAGLAEPAPLEVSR